MKLVTALVIFAILTVSINGASVTDLPPPNTATNLPMATDNVSFDKKTTKSTSTTTSTEASTTESTTTPATSTTPQSTSTEPSTSTKPSTSTTTSTPTAPTTTTVGPTTTTSTQAPTPMPTPKMGSWSLTENNKTCILVAFAAQLNISYIASDDKMDNKEYNVPSDAHSVSGTCGNGTNDQHINITWQEQSVNYTLSMNFKLNQTTNEFAVNELVFVLGAEIFPNAKNQSFIFYSVGNAFETYKGKSYHCTRVQKQNLTDGVNSPNLVGTVSFSQTQLEAFRSSNTKEFSAAIDCDAISTPDIVPIAVGIALIVLVVVVLIAYVVGRRRQNPSGYESM